MARFLIDESLPLTLADELKKAGHEADHVTSVGMAGASDDEVYARAESTGAILVTRDLDFADKRQFRGGIDVIVVRLRSRIRARELVDTVVRLVQEAAPQLEDHSGKIVILEPGRIRIRSR